MSKLGITKIYVYKYNTILYLKDITGSEINLNTTIQSIMYNIQSNTNISFLTSLDIVPGLLEMYNLMFTEKMIRGLDNNFPIYYKAFRPTLNYPHHHRYGSIKGKYLTRKYFSGDVSGMIAESLFIYLLNTLGIDISTVGHLRPHKIKGSYTPDFVIWDNSRAIYNLVSNVCTPPVYAEVKGSTGNIDPNRLKRAISQLNNVIMNNKCGIIFYVYRSPNYICMIFEVHP